MATRVWAFLRDEGRALGASIGGGLAPSVPVRGPVLRAKNLTRAQTAASPQFCKIDAPACPMAFRPKLDSVVHCTAGIIGEAGSIL